jgi:hypothetical protein
MLYEEPLKDRSSRRDVWHSWNATTALGRPKTAATTAKQRKCKVNEGLRLTIVLEVIKQAAGSSVSI